MTKAVEEVATVEMAVPVHLVLVAKEAPGGGVWADLEVRVGMVELAARVRVVAAE